MTQVRINGLSTWYHRAIADQRNITQMSGHITIDDATAFNVSQGFDLPCQVTTIFMYSHC